MHKKMQLSSTAKSVLQLYNSLDFQGYSFGYTTPACGVLTFTTATAGFPENLTDPSFEGQILCVTYPQIGNYGAPAEVVIDNICQSYESENCHIRGLIVTDMSFDYSHWNAVCSLNDWLIEHKIPGIYGVDTRAITKVVRESGSMLCQIIPDGFDPVPMTDPYSENLVERVSCKEVIRYAGPKGCKKVVLVDCGVKHNILRILAGNGVEIIRVPWNYDFNNDPATAGYDGLVISNGPGNPTFLKETVAHIKEAMAKGKPVLGVCMGNLLLAMAAGAKVVKLKSGHHTNQPVRMSGTQRCYTTSQNHSFAIAAGSLPEDWKVTYENLNDGTIEGIAHKSLPFQAIQFYPEAYGYEVDTAYIFESFIKSL